MRLLTPRPVSRSSYVSIEQIPVFRRRLGPFVFEKKESFGFFTGTKCSLQLPEGGLLFRIIQGPFFFPRRRECVYLPNWDLDSQQKSKVEKTGKGLGHSPWTGQTLLPEETPLTDEPSQWSQSRTYFGCQNRGRQHQCAQNAQGTFLILGLWTQPPK